MPLFRHPLLVRTIPLWCLLFVLSSPATAADVSADKVKSALIFSVTKFTDWPETSFDGASSPVRVCTLEKRFVNLRGKKTKGRTIKVLVVKLSEVTAQRCHALFLSTPSTDKLEKLINAIQQQPILTVSDTHGFAAKGGMVELRLVDGSMKLFINHQAVQRSGVSLSARLLKLSTIVKPD